MRVLHVVATTQRRGGEVFASDLVRALGPAGVGQRVAVLHGGAVVTTPYEAPVDVLSSDGEDPSSRHAVRRIAGLRRVVADWRPDVIQAHGGEPLKYAAFAAPPGRIVYRRIGFADARVTRGPRRLVHGRLMRRSARVVAVAEAVRREVVETFGVRPSRVVTIPNAVDARRLVARESGTKTRRTLGIDASAKVVSVLGALTEEKDPLGHLRVAEEVSAGCPGAVVLFVGDGPLRPAVERAARDSGGAARVLGARSDVAELLAASDLLLLASRTEGMPGCLIEAGMVGVPCVAAAHPGVKEIVRDGETGALVAPNEPRAAAAAVLRLLEDDAARGRMAEAARRWCRGRFDVHAVAPRYLEVYAEVAGEREGSSRTGDATPGPRRPA